MCWCSHIGKYVKSGWIEPGSFLCSPDGSQLLLAVLFFPGLLLQSPGMLQEIPLCFAEASASCFSHLLCIFGMSVFWGRKWTRTWGHSFHQLYHLSPAQPKDPTGFSVSQAVAHCLCFALTLGFYPMSRISRCPPGTEADPQFTSWRLLIWNAILFHPFASIALLCLSTMIFEFLWLLFLLSAAYWPPTCVKAEVKWAWLPRKAPDFLTSGSLHWLFAPSATFSLRLHMSSGFFQLWSSLCSL